MGRVCTSPDTGVSMAAAKRTAGAEEWWQTLSERDAFQHSQNFACCSIAPPCQNRGPAKDERKIHGYAHVWVARDAYVNNLEPSAGRWPTASRSLRMWSARPL